MNIYKFNVNVIVIRRIIKRVTFDISVSGLVLISIVMRFKVYLKSINGKLWH